MGSAPVSSAPISDGFALTQQACERLVANRVNLGLTDLTVTPLLRFLQAAENGLPSGVTSPPPNQNLLSPQQWEAVVDQAEILLGSLYPHLPFKQKDFAGAVPPVDPVGDLVNLRSVVQSPTRILSELDFHIQMLKVFATVRDPHTAYILPQFFHGAVAFLPFRAGFYVDEQGKNRFLVISVMNGFDHPDFKPGAELISDLPDFPDFTPTVERAAKLTPGANIAAQILRGVLRLTVLPLALSGTTQWREPYDNLTAGFTYLPPGSSEKKSIAMPWNVAQAAGLNTDFGGEAFSISSDLVASLNALTALWTAPPTPGGAQPDSVFPDVFGFQTTGGISSSWAAAQPLNLVSAQAPGKQFGYIAIRKFNTAGPENLADALLGEFDRILKLLQPVAPDGLILDLRGNPGGSIEAAEGMLQMLMPSEITPANFHLANTSTVLKALSDIADSGTTDSDLQNWLADRVGAALPDGPPLTSGQPLTVAGNLKRQQVYQGPIALLVDAVTYSAADIFTGGFKDNGIGIVIGADAMTGGGGASNLELADLMAILPASAVNLKTLPRGLKMTLAFRRSSRVLANAGMPIEDLGVGADRIVPRTANELLFAGGERVHSDMIFAACDLLADMPVHRVDVVRLPGTAQWTIRATNLDSIDFLLDQDPNPAQPTPAANLGKPMNIPLNSSGGFPRKIVVRGFSDGSLRTSTTVAIVESKVRA